MTSPLIARPVSVAGIMAHDLVAMSWPTRISVTVESGDAATVNVLIPFTVLGTIGMLRLRERGRGR